MMYVMIGDTPVMDGVECDESEESAEISREYRNSEIIAVSLDGVVYLMDIRHKSRAPSHRRIISLPYLYLNPSLKRLAWTLRLA